MRTLDSGSQFRGRGEEVLRRDEQPPAAAELRRDEGAVGNVADDIVVAETHVGFVRCVDEVWPSVPSLG